MISPNDAITKAYEESMFSFISFLAVASQAIRDGYEWIHYTNSGFKIEGKPDEGTECFNTTLQGSKEAFEDAIKSGIKWFRIED